MDHMIYALNDPDSANRSRVFSSLKQGEGRFGWSYCPTANLRELKSKIDAAGWEAGLSAEEKDCYQGFLLDLKADDYVVYINVNSLAILTP
jgi:hypothetical protein